jgi:hypothetical protein
MEQAEALFKCCPELAQELLIHNANLEKECHR